MKTNHQRGYVANTEKSQHYGNHYLKLEAKNLRKHEKIILANLQKNLEVCEYCIFPTIKDISDPWSWD